MAKDDFKKGANPFAMNDNEAVVDESWLEQDASIFGNTPQAKSKNQQRIESLEAQKAEYERELEKLQEITSVVDSGGAIYLGRCTVTKIGLQMPDDLSRDEWVEIGDQLFQLEASIQWMIGDWLAFGENKKYGDGRQIAEQLGKNPGTLHNWAWVSRELPEVSYRYEILSHTHHQVVVSMAKPRQYQKWLERASIGDNGKPWSVSRLRQEIKGFAKNPKSNAVDPTAISRQMREVAKLYQLDPSTLRPQKRDEYLGKISSLRRILDDLESKLSD